MTSSKVWWDCVKIKYIVHQNMDPQDNIVKQKIGNPTIERRDKS